MTNTSGPQETGCRKRARDVQERYVTPQSASHMLAHALGHGYSRQTVVRLVEEGRLRAHRLPPRGYIWIETDSVLALILSVLDAPVS